MARRKGPKDNRPAPKGARPTPKGSRPTPKGSQASARAVAAAGGTRRDLSLGIGVVVVVVIAAAVVVGVLLQQHRTTQAAQTVIPALTVPGSSAYPTTLDKATATVLVGKPTAKVTIDAYEDFLCPVCGQFESDNFTAIERQLAAGTLRVRYHLLNLLDSGSTPPGYSMLAANTALAVAAAAPDKFIDFHYSLYQKQPAENGPGWTQAQLTSLANRLGVSGPAFDAVVGGRTYDGQIQNNLTSAEKNPALAQTGSDGTKSFGTPTIVANNQIVNYQNAGWLDALVKSATPG